MEQCALSSLVQYLVYSGFAIKGSLVCTQPRKVAAMSLQQRVLGECKGCYGGIQLVNCFTTYTPRERSLVKVNYMTDHVLLQLFVFLNALFATASYVGPQLIYGFVKFLTTKQHSIHTGYMLACAFFGAKFIETIAQRKWIFGTRQLGMHLREALTAHIYKKGLHLSSEARQGHGSGEIINYMSVDVQCIGYFAWNLNTIWMMPIQILLATYILIKTWGFGITCRICCNIGCDGRKLTTYDKT